MKRREFLKTAGAALLAEAATAFSVCAQGAPAREPWNLLFVTVDDMDGSMPGWMGNPLKLTPNLDAFAAGCHRFVNNHDAAPICQPSREAMMTGLCPNHSGALGFNPVNPGTPTLVTVLKANGYFAGGINKLEHMAPTVCFPWDAKFDDPGRDPDLFASEVGDVIARSQAAKKPFFLNVNIHDPHRPFYGPQEQRKMGLGHGDGGPIENLVRVIKPEEATPPSFLENLPEVRNDYAAYCNSVQRADASFGKIIGAVKAAGMLDRTIVIFVADHGMPFPMAKATCYHHGSHCPVLLRWPGMIAAQTHDHVTSSLDIMPTLLALLGVTPPALQDGTSWLPWIGKPGGAPERDHAICNVNGVSNHQQFPMRAVTTKTGSLIVTMWADGKNRLAVESMDSPTFHAMEAGAKSDPKLAGRLEQYLHGYPLAYYDLVKDPDQRMNLLKDPQYASEIDRLQKILLDYMETTKDDHLADYKTILAGGIPVFDSKVRKGKRGGKARAMQEETPATAAES